MKVKRIYHPTLNVFRDVPAEQADSWKDQGWRFTNPGQVSAAEGGVGDEKPVTDTYPYRAGEGPAAATTVAVIGPDPAAQATPPAPTATPTTTRP